MHKLTLQLPDDVYTPLLDKAQRVGRTPEELAVECVTSAVHRSEDDPLIQLLGSVDADVSDVALQHDTYIGDQLLRESRSVA